MDKGNASSLFVNDGSFMEKFKKIQDQKQEKEMTTVELDSDISGNSALRPNAAPNKAALSFKTNDMHKSNSTNANGKLAFSLKQKSKLAVAPIMLGAEEDEDDEYSLKGPSDVPAKRQKLIQLDASEPSLRQGDVVPSSPSDPIVKKVSDKLASFVAKNGRQFEHITRQRNPGETPFKFLFDADSADYKYYEYRLVEEEKKLAERKNSQAPQSAGTSPPSAQSSGRVQRSDVQLHSNYQIPMSALYEANREAKSFSTPLHTASVGTASSHSEANGSSTADPIAMMEFYVKKAAQEERRREPKLSKDEMPPPASLQAPVRRGHHMGDYIPQEELEKFLSSCNDAAAQKAAKETAERAKIQADNVGHKLLSKMGWKEGEGLGSSKSGRADPVVAGNVKLNNLGVGAEQPGEVTPDDDIYEQYKKRMMLGYRFRPNPLNNPRKSYY